MYAKPGQTHCFDCGSAFVPAAGATPTSLGNLYIGCPNGCGRGTVAVVEADADHTEFVDFPASPDEAGAAEDYAYRSGREYCAQVLDDSLNHQDGPGRFGDHDDIPDADHTDLVRRFGEVTEAMVGAYKRGYNDRADEEE